MAALRRIGGALRRRWSQGTARSRLRLAQVRLSRLRGGPAPIRLLLVTDGREYTSEQQLAPLWRHADALARATGLVLRRIDLDAAMALPVDRLRRFDAVGLKLSFRTTPDTARCIAARLRLGMAEGQRLIYFDGDDDPGVQWPEVLGLSDAWVKKHVFAAPEQYLRRRIGKTNLTDHVAHTHGTDFSTDIIPASAPVDAEDLPKIVTGWNIALDDKIAALAALALPGRARDIDVSCRAMVPPGAWIAPLRAPAVAAIDAMADRHRVLAPTTRVTPEAYREELLRSRISVSPFGFGEICWRDFEVMLCGALLIKPDMGHLRCLPDLFRPHETYVPVAWDYADLGPVCDRYLADEPARRAIAERAATELRQALREDRVVQRIAATLAQARLPIPSGATG